MHFYIKVELFRVILLFENLLIITFSEISGKSRLECPSAEDQGTITFRLPGSPFSPRFVAYLLLGNYLSISISTNSLGLLSISTFINSTQADSYQYQLNLSCSNQLINLISTFIPKLLFFSQKLLFQAYLLGNSHVELV